MSLRSTVGADVPGLVTEPHHPSWQGLAVAVTGAGRTGTAVAGHLTSWGAVVTLMDDTAPGAVPSTAGLPAATALVVTSPGLPPTHPLLVEAQELGIPVWGEVELAWRLRGEAAAPWLAVTGTNGKTTTTAMVELILGVAGKRAHACGNYGPTVIDAVLADPPHDYLAVELSSFQLATAPSPAPLAAAVLNIADDHVDWHGSALAYASAKAAVWSHASTIAIGNRDDDVVAALLQGAPGTQVGFTLGPPGPGDLGLVVDTVEHTVLLVDRAFAAGAPARADLVTDAGELESQLPHDVANALAAAALCLAAGIDVGAVDNGLLRYRRGAHRNEPVAEVGGITFVNDSKATNAHAARASLTAHVDVVWIAGGFAKGQDYDALVAEVGPGLRGAVLIGEAADVLADLLARHAPQVTVLRGVSMDDAVVKAHGLAVAGGTVLLAPAAASMDMFDDYADRGAQFVAAVERLA